MQKNVENRREREREREREPVHFVISLDFADFGEEVLEKQIVIGAGTACLSHPLSLSLSLSLSPLLALTLLSVSDFLTLTYTNLVSLLSLQV